MAIALQNEMRQIDLAPDLPAYSGAPWPGVRYFTTGRTGGASRAPFDGFNLAAHVGDEPAAVRANRVLLRRALPAEPLWLDQVHGTAVADADVLSPGFAAPRADAAVTTARARPLAILTADCLPVVMCAGDALVLGVAHAGWRGLLAGVLENTAQQMRARLAPEARAAQLAWRAWIGPAIGQAAFEVGHEVYQAFVQTDARLAQFFLANARGRWQADLAGIAQARLLAWGFGAVQRAAACTFALEAQFYSYRRAASCGRQATVAWLD